jgi:hypothetical protein
MTEEERKEILEKLDTLEDFFLTMIRDIRNERNKIILHEEGEKDE